MTTEKTEGKKTRVGGTPSASNAEELQVAKEIHTLAQIVYGEIAMTHPWVHPVPTLAGFEPAMSWLSPGASGALAPWPLPTTWSW